MRFLRVSVSVLAIICVLLTILLVVSESTKKDGPTLDCSAEQPISVPTNVTDEELLKLVTATDKIDGDISNKIVVERQRYFLEKGLSTVIFSVCDSDNNTAKLYRQIKFTDYESPEIQFHNDFIISTRDSIDFKSSVSVADKYDGDISRNVKVISPNFNNLVSGEYDVNFKVTNSFGDNCNITIKAIVTDEDYSDASINLSQYSYYTKKGEDIDFNKFIKNVVNSEGARYNTSNIVIDSNEYNPNEDGVYNIYYSIKSGSRTVTKTRLVVVVRGQ